MSGCDEEVPAGCSEWRGGALSAAAVCFTSSFTAEEEEEEEEAEEERVARVLSATGSASQAIAVAAEEREGEPCKEASSAIPVLLASGREPAPPEVAEETAGAAAESPSRGVLFFEVSLTLFKNCRKKSPGEKG